MEFKIEKERLFLENDSGRETAHVEFPKDENCVYQITHTFVDDSLRGHGVASDMMKLIAEEMRKRKSKAHPVCSFAQQFFEKNSSEYSDIISE